MSQAVEKIKCAFNPQNVLFITQVSCIFIVVCVSLLNLTLEVSNPHLWTMLLTSSLAFLMPSPKFKPIDQVKEESKVVKQQENNG